MEASSQLPLVAGEQLSSASRPRSVHRRPRLTPGMRTRTMTSLEMSFEERDLLDELAKAEGISIAEVLRRGLALYATAHNEPEKEAA